MSAAATRVPQGSAEVAARLEELGWNAARLSRELGVGAPVVSRWLSGERRPSLRWAVEIERLLGVPMETWLVDSTPPCATG